MKEYLQHVNPKIVAAAIACLALFIFVGGSTSALGQANTFPASGNVGIGTSSPAIQLHVVNSSNAQGRVESTSASAAAFDFKNPNRRWVIGTGVLGGGGDFSIYDGNAALTRMYFDTSGRVGIGTTTPGRALEVLAANGEALRLYRNGNFANWGINMVFALNNSSGAQVDYAGVHGVIGTNTAGAEVGHLVLSTVTNGSLIEKVRVTGSGNVGIGTTTPGEFVHVRKDQNAATHLLVENTTAGASSQADLQVKNNLGHSAQFGLYSSTTTTYGAIASGNAFAFTTSPAMVIMANNGSGIIKFATGGINERMRIDANGSVGINTLTPNSSYKLDVNGNTNVTGSLNATGTITGGTIQAKYQDVAEWVQSSQQLLAGTVVVLDHTKSNQVIASSQAYDTRVAGVISLQPGITLGENGAGKVLVATTGRVKVKVDASAGPIAVGDLLVTGDKEGFAKKSEPLNLGGVAIHRPGTLIGKALEPLEKGTGEILVLLSLQ